MRQRTQVFIIVMLFIAMSAIGWGIPVKGFDGDCWRNWTIHLYKYGLGLAYHSGTDYPPFYLYVLFIFGKIAGSEQAIISYLTCLKSVTLAFDFLGLWYVYKWIDRKIDFTLLLVISMLNIGYSYNSVIWGQVDGIFTAL